LSSTVLPSASLSLVAVSSGDCTCRAGGGMGGGGGGAEMVVGIQHWRVLLHDATPTLIHRIAVLSN
jgi:hypothetical protein